MKLVLIGGGDHNRDTDPTIIDSSIVSFSNKETPNFLFIGLASKYSDSKYDQMKKIYQKLNCHCSYLKRKNLIHNPQIVRDKIYSADIIYFCGGDTIQLLEDVHTFQLENLLRDAFNHNCVLVGSSAWAILLVDEGFSDSYILRGEYDSYAFIKGLSFCHFKICPHYHSDPLKTKQLISYLKNNKDFVYGIEEGTALFIHDQNTYTISSINNHVYKLSYDDHFIEEYI